MIKWLKENSIIFCIIIALCVIVLSVAIITNGKKDEEFLITNEEGDRTIWNDFSLLSFLYYENVSQNKINRKASIYETGKEKVLSIKEADSIDEAKEELGFFQNDFSIKAKKKENMLSYKISSLLYSCDLELNSRKYQNSIMEGTDIENINCFCELSAGGKLGKNIFSKHIFLEK